mmetsp:Transcript_29002/g.61544  ORF Transcript_29002/g.61544 Transcript_29002/m.61544 type:complete len:95 (-) Transcript_29002:43-327(-)
MSTFGKQVCRRGCYFVCLKSRLQNIERIPNTAEIGKDFFIEYMVYASSSLVYHQHSVDLIPLMDGFGSYLRLMHAFTNIRFSLYKSSNFAEQRQ